MPPAHQHKKGSYEDDPMSAKFDVYIIHVLHRLLTSISNEHPAALPVALWMGENSELFGVVPQPWDRTRVEPVIWRALLRVVSRRLDMTTTKGSTADRLQRAGLGANPHIADMEAEILIFLAVIATCECMKGFVAFLAEGTGLSKKQTLALCLGATDAELDELLTGRLARAGLIEKGEASPALLCFASE